MTFNTRQELSASSMKNGSQRMHSDTTHSDHIYNYIEEQTYPKHFFSQKSFSAITQNKKLRYTLIPAAFIIVLAMILTIVLTLKAKGGKGNEDTEEPKELARTIFFAFHTDYDVLYKEVRNGDSCSFAKNIISAQHAFLEMKHQRFRLIFFADRPEASEKMDWLKAIEKLETAISLPNPPTTFKQYPVLQEFVNTRGDDDLLVYFVPCSFNYSASDSDLEIVRGMIRIAHIEEHVMIIFTNVDGESIKEWYGVSQVVGKGENVIDRIIEFVLRGTTTAKPRLSTEPIFPSTATFDDTSAYTGTLTTAAPESIIVCVVDVQYITRAEEIEKEKSLILKVVEKLFNERQDSLASIWAYGSVAQRNDYANVLYLAHACSNYLTFKYFTDEAMRRGAQHNDLGRNFTTINTATGPEWVAESLLFLWGADFVEENWIITPNYNYTKIVVVSLQGADFTRHVDNRGVIINVSLDDYDDEDVQKIVEALLS